MKETPLPFTVFCDDGLGFSSCFAGQRGKKSDKSIDVVSIDMMHVPTESSEFLIELASGAHIAKTTIDLQSIGIDDCDKIAKRFSCGEISCFPHLAFFAFAIAQDRIDPSDRLL